MRLKVEYIPIDTLKPYDKNAKIHTKEQIEQIKKSITDFGMNDPIAIWGKDNKTNKKTFQVVQQKINYELYDSAKRVAKSDYSISSDFFTTPRGKRAKADDNFADRYNKYRKYTKISNEMYDRAIKRGLVQI